MTMRVFHIIARGFLRSLVVRWVTAIFMGLLVGALVGGATNSGVAGVVVGLVVTGFSVGVFEMYAKA